MMEDIQQQLDELECVLSMFPEDGELVYDAALLEAYRSCLPVPSGETPVSLPARKLEYSIRFQSHAINGHIPELEIAYPHTYPTTAQVQFVVHSPMLTRQQMEAMQTDLLLIATGNNSEPVVLQLYQCMADALSDASASLQQQQQSIETTVQTKEVVQARTLGRRAIYFHHIIAPTKRRVVKEWALELGLGGFSKIGWPGVVVAEGDEACVQDYVSRLQHLRWQQMTVRGEQTEPVPAPKSIDDLRRFPRGFCEFGETQMSDAAALCRQVGLEELFLTVMKIYRSTSA